MLHFLQEIDEIIILTINCWNTPFLDSVMWWISGKTSWWPLYLFLIFILVKNFSWKKTSLILLFIILIIILSDQTSVHLFKNVFKRLRPSHNPDLANILHFVNNYRGGSFGFISSHASNTFAVAAFIVMNLRKKWITVLLATWASLVAYSRVYLGVHYLSDVFVGALWGILLALVMYIVFEKIKIHVLHTGNKH